MVGKGTQMTDAFKCGCEPGNRQNNPDCLAKKVEGCCEEDEAKCLACKDSVSVYEYCLFNHRTYGCPYQIVQDQCNAMEKSIELKELE